MQRDVKIGLALGLLLVVVVAALFFRREPQPVAGPPALSDPDSLNRAIGERERSPYVLGEPEDFAANPARPPSARAPSSERETTRTERSRIPGILTSDDEDLHNRLLLGSRSSIPDPIPSAQNRNPIPDELTASDAPSGNGTRVHVIKGGDNLGLLAQKYLGSSTRFQEIFDANKGVLKNPNQLPVGVTIVIPPKQVASHSPASEPAERSVPSQPEPTPLSAVTDGPTPVSESHKPKDTAAADKPKDPLTSIPPARKKLFSPSRRGPLGRPVRSQSNPVPESLKESARSSQPAVREPARPAPELKAPPKTDVVSTDAPTIVDAPSLPKIDVEGSSDLLSPDNETIKRP